jgi:hypothetical protein
MSERMRLLTDGSLIIGGTVRDFEGQLEIRAASGVASVDVFAASGSEAKIQLLNNNNSSAIGCGTGGSLIFYGNTRATERMRMDASGNFCIGTNTASRRLTVAGDQGVGILPTSQDGISTLSASSAGITLLDCFHNTAASVFVVQVQPTGGSSTAERLRVNAAGVTVTGTLTETSTIRIKKNVRPIEGALEKVMGLQGVVYDMIDDSAHEQHGLIAEEVQKVLPNVVYRDEDGEVAGVQYARVVAVLIEAMKEQEARIKALEAIIAKG